MTYLIGLKGFEGVFLVVILGIDPGYALVGYGAVDFVGGRYRYIGSGVISTAAKDSLFDRLEEIFDETNKLVNFCKPKASAIESLYFQNNQKTAIKVAQARGIILLALKKNDIPIHEYTPLQVKSAVTGYGKAQKCQVMMTTKMLLNLREIPKPDDAADALAIAICHANCSNSLLLREKG